MNDPRETIDRPLLRIGIGHDTHRVGNGGPLILGGVRIDAGRHLIGHSDADVLLHAVTDSLLGAAGAGDIGELYPDTDPANRNRDSKQILSSVHQLVQRLGYQLINVDCIIFAEEPKLGPLKQEMRRSIAMLLEVDESQVSVKAKTGEGLDAVGQGVAISAQCIALLRKTP